MIARRRATPARALLALPLALVALVVLAPAAGAHPLGNFTVNSYSGLRVEPQAVAVRLIVDSAEIPTVQEFPEANTAGGVPPAEAAAHAERECASLRPGLQLDIDGARADLAVRSSELALLPGEGGLRTMRLTCELRTAGAVETVGSDLEYVDRNSLSRTGWREITAVGDGVGLTDSSVPADSLSDQLADYPQDLLESPLDQRAASLHVVAGDGTVSGGGAATSGAQGAAGERSTADALTESFTDLVATRDLGVGLAVLALLLSVGLGALHAFAPGHGKTLMAAYLLGQRSSLRQVGVIGLTVTMTHTAGVLVLGLVLTALALTASADIYAWLGLASGVLLLAIGYSLLRQARRRAAEPSLPERAADLVGAGVGHGHDHGEEHGHDHGHGAGHDHRHDHDHHGHGHDHDQERAHPAGVTHSHGWGGSHTHPPPASSARGMIAVGFAGGMVPSPSALIVLIGGISLGRAWFGVLLVIAYGIGMALALIGTGLALAHARDRVEAWAERRRQSGRAPGALLRATRMLPTLTAGLVMVVGIGLAARSVLAL